MLTRFALANRALTLSLLVVALLAGPLSFITHPSREDPEITIRMAVVTAQFPGMAPDRIEDLITRPLEEAIREMPEVENLISTSRTGQAMVKVDVHPRYADMDPIWSTLRDKMEDLAPDLPEGTRGPFVDDEYGDVAMATAALTAEGFEMWEMREAAREIRRRLYAVEGVGKVELFGVEEQRIFVEFDNVRLSQLGLDPQAIIDEIERRNVILPGGTVQADGFEVVVEPTGNFETIADVEAISIDIPEADGGFLYLRDIAEVRFGYRDPPQRPALYNGAPAIILSVEMIDGQDSDAFGRRLRTAIEGFEQALPIGFSLDFVTFQPNEISAAIEGVGVSLVQTVAVVLAVVLAFLGLRAGLIVGFMAPAVMVVTVLVMRWVGIELERMSLATLIIALGLLIDNGIVVVEDIKARLQTGEPRLAAAEAAGSSLAMPLLAASATTVLAFMPLMLAADESGEYTRSISLVMLISLGVSWLVALTILPLASVLALKAPPPVDERVAYGGRLYDGYRRLIRATLSWRGPALLGVVAIFAAGLWAFQFVPKNFFPASERTQLQVEIDLPKSAGTLATREVVRRIAGFLNDAEANPEVVDHVGYVGHGGPRFYLGLAPIDAEPSRAFMIVNVARPEQIAPLLRRLRDWGLTNLPEARIMPKPMSMGPGEAGLVQFRIFGSDPALLKGASERLQSAMRAFPLARNVKDDWGDAAVAMRVVVDQTRANRAGVTSEEIARALNSQLAGVTVTDYRRGDTEIPVVLRALGDQRENLDRVRTLNVAARDGRPIPLLQIAEFEGAARYANLQRRNMRRVVTVSGVEGSMTAQAFDAALGPAVREIATSLPPGYRIERGGEIENSADAQAALFANVPLAFALMVLILIGLFDSVRKPLIVLLTIPLTLVGVSLGLLIAPGANFSFMGILGFLALAGIVINNAIVLLDRIDVEQAAGRALDDAIVEAGVRRLRPILMTTCTTALGLLPIILARDVLFYDLAVVIAGGLIAGTALTLGVAPVLASIVLSERRGPAPAPQPA